jgi:hypothetical protein
MAWIARNNNGILVISNNKPVRVNLRRLKYWSFDMEMLLDEHADTYFVQLPSDADERLIGRHITWEDEPVEIE